MKITFISNFLNHHQLPFCMEMCNKKNIDFYFIATEKIPEERLILGYEDINAKYPFVIETYKSNDDKNRALNIINNSDIVIIGSAPEEYIVERLRENKITFRYSERIFKRGLRQIIDPRVILSMLKNHTKYNKKNLYMLCASAYTANDYALVNAYKNKCYKWGYFPETKKYDIYELIEKKEQNKTIKLLWVARFIDWKHPELPIMLAKWLKSCGYSFKIQMIGCGPLLDKIKEQVIMENLSDYIELLGSVKSTDVRRYMEDANIFLATSDQNEGWGAVVNEAMNSGCAIVGNKRIGSIPYLVKDGKNGLVYENKKEFFNKVKWLIDNVQERKRISIEAYNTIIITWNAKNAVNNLLGLCDKLLNDEDTIIEEGPCSKAINVKE